MSFFTFETFISTYALIVFYYLGALFMPLIIWKTSIKALEKYVLIHDLHQEGKSIIWTFLNNKQRIQVTLFFASTLFFAEIFWRMMFEFLIAYMQIRDALVMQTL